MGKPTAVDVESLQYSADAADGDTPIEGPANDIGVLLAGFEAIEDAVEEKGVFVEASLQEAEIAAVELNPESCALQMFQPASPQVAPPVILHPASNGCFAQIAARFFAFDPLEQLGFFFAFEVDATLLHGLLARGGHFKLQKPLVF